MEVTWFSPLLKRGHQEQVAQACVLVTFENL